eukprot:jgi/Ulvmu1/7930/UM004_0162.1
MVGTMTKEERIRRHLARMQSQRKSKAFCVWRDHVRLCRLQETFLQLFPPSLCAAFSLPPAQRVRQHVDEIHGLFRGQHLPWARALPDMALRHACRHMSYEVLHDDMVLPRCTEDQSKFFAVFYGAPVQVAYGALGASILSQARENSRMQAPADLGEADGKAHAKQYAADMAELVHAFSHPAGTDMQEADRQELSRRQQARAHLSPASLRDAWGSHLQPTAGSLAAQPTTASTAEESGQQSSTGAAIAGLSPGAAAANRAQTPLQHALLCPGETFTGTSLKGWTKQATAWPSPIQAHVARSSPGLFSVVLVLPGDVVMELVQVVMQRHLQRTVDLCLRVPAFRHLSVSVLTGLAQYCNESHVPSRHELLRQHHPITHVHLLISGSVDVTAFVPGCWAELDPLTLSCHVHSNQYADLAMHRSSVAGDAHVQGSQTSGATEQSQFKLKLGRRHGPCILGDEPTRSSKCDSLVSVTTSSPCHLLSVPLAAFKASMEGMTSRLFDQLRKPESTAQVLLEAVSMHRSAAAAELRDRNTKLKEVFGRSAVPKALDRTRDPPSACAWVPPGRKLGLFLEFVTLDQGERGAYESPQQHVARIVNLVILHLVDAVGGLPALAARMQMGNAGRSFSLFADSIVKELVQNRLTAMPLKDVLNAIGEGELPAAAEEAVRARLIALGMLEESRVRTTPLVKQVRSTSVAVLGPAQPASARKYRFVDLGHPESLAARSTHEAETLDSACFIQLALHLPPKYMLGRSFQASAACLDSVASAWAKQCTSHGSCRLVRVSSHVHAVVMSVDRSADRSSIALHACTLCCDLADLAREACMAGDPPMPFQTTAVLSYGSITMLTQHGKCVTSFRGSAPQTATVILDAAVNAQHRHGTVVVAADALQALVADRYQWLPEYGGHVLVAPITNRQYLPSNFGVPTAQHIADNAATRPGDNGHSREAADVGCPTGHHMKRLSQQQQDAKAVHHGEFRNAAAKSAPGSACASGHGMTGALKCSRARSRTKSSLVILRQRQSMTAMAARQLVRQDLDQNTEGGDFVAGKSTRSPDAICASQTLKEPAFQKYSKTVLTAAKDKGSKHGAHLCIRGASRHTLSLDLCGLGLETMPDCGTLTWLQRLSASCNQLTAFPCLNAPALIRLNLAHNLIGSLPETIAGCMANVQELDVSYNRLQCLPQGIRIMASLCAISLRCNRLTQLPNLGGLHALRYLDASDNMLMEIPASLGDCHNLCHLNLSGNRLTVIPACVSSLQDLEYLSLAGNVLEKRATIDLGNLHNLCALDLACNYLSSLNLTGWEAAAGGTVPAKLRTLCLSDNKFCEFPEGIPTTMVKLDVSHNRLVSLPAWLGRRCVALSELMLHHNGIQSLDHTILRLPNLQLLSLHHNPVCDESSPLSAALAQNASVAAMKQALTTNSNHPTHSSNSHAMVS